MTLKKLILPHVISLCLLWQLMVPLLVIPTLSDVDTVITDPFCEQIQFYFYPKTVFYMVREGALSIKSVFTIRIWKECREVVKSSNLKILI